MTLLMNLISTANIILNKQTYFIACGTTNFKYSFTTDDPILLKHITFQNRNIYDYG